MEHSSALSSGLQSPPRSSDFHRGCVFAPRVAPVCQGGAPYTTMRPLSVVGEFTCQSAPVREPGMIKRQTPTRILPTRIGLERLHRLPSSVADTVTTRFGFLGFCERAVGIDPNDRHDFDDGGGDAPGTAST